MTLRQLWAVLGPHSRVAVREERENAFECLFVPATYIPENERLSRLMDREVIDAFARNDRLYVTMEAKEPPSSLEGLTLDEEEKPSELHVIAKSVIVRGENFEIEVDDAKPWKAIVINGVRYTREDEE